MLSDFVTWARRVAEFDVFGLRAEEQALHEDAAALEKEIAELRADISRETARPNWALRRRLRRVVRSERDRKVRALRRYNAFLVEEGIQKLENPAEAERILQEANVS